jgi:hypothetical protein
MGQQTREHRSQQAGRNDTHRGDEVTLAAFAWERTLAVFFLVARPSVNRPALH